MGLWPCFFQTRLKPNRKSTIMQICKDVMLQVKCIFAKYVQFSLAVCRYPCGFGICRSPNLCQCITGQFGQQCTSAGTFNNIQTSLFLKQHLDFTFPSKQKQGGPDDFKDYYHFLRQLPEKNICVPCYRILFYVIQIIQSYLYVIQIIQVQLFYPTTQDSYITCVFIRGLPHFFYTFFTLTTYSTQYMYRI